MRPVWVIAVLMWCACAGDRTPSSQRPIDDPGPCTDSSCCAPSTPHGCLEWGDHVYGHDRALANRAYMRGCNLRVGEACRKAGDIAWTSRDEARARELWKFGCALGATCPESQAHLRTRSLALTAEEAWEQGRRAYTLGEFELAVGAFTRGYELDPRPVFLYNIAQAYRQIGDTDHAMFFYKRFLQIGEPTEQMRRRVEEYIRELEERARLRRVPREQPVDS